MKKPTYWQRSSVAIVASIAAILIATAVLIFKLGQRSVSPASWSEYDDYGWS